MGPLVQALGSQAKRDEDQSYSFPIFSTGFEAGGQALLFAWLQIFLLLDRVVMTQICIGISILMLPWLQSLNPFSNQGKIAEQSGCLLQRSRIRLRFSTLLLEGPCVAAQKKAMGIIAGKLRQRGAA